ncbi:MAG TPA: 2-oxoacid:ferredoxin oxidoreductase subunit alpha [Thermoplasmata archaeon]|nr:2-oxoacid:ferredoxin oxidoreductase subunit alpha [Thermoplasmata archaeon]
MKTNDLAWLIGGAQGSGVDSSANIFGRACAFGGLQLFGKREYYSNIMGEHSYFLIRASASPIRSIVDPVNVLATFDAETVFRHAQSVTDDGAIVYDPDVANVKIDEIPTLEARVAQDLKAYLIARGVGETVKDALDACAQRGVQLRPIPMTDFLTNVQKKFQVDSLSKLTRMVNVLAVAASFGLLAYDFAPLEKAIRYTFSGKPKVAEMNVYGARLAYDHARAEGSDGFAYRLTPVPTEERRVYLTGSQAIALGKMLGGCRFQTYYPIAPASDESEYMESHEVIPLATEPDSPEAQEATVLAENGGSSSLLVVQTEDEIAAITMATGAALAGTRSATATSGPGFCLMMEGIGWAAINEVPVVITLYQRAGPSTGLPTRHEQGDLRFAIHAGHGESPRIVFASGDVRECFYDAVKAFNFADQYQLPVIHLVDKALANSYQTEAYLTPHGVRIDRGALAVPGGEDDGYLRFRFTQSGISPRAVLGMPGTIFWNTGDEHDERGHITEDPVLHILMMDKRMGKLDLALKEIPPADQFVYHGDADAETVVISWGSTKGALLDAMDGLRKEGHKIGFLQMRLLHPFPAAAVEKLLKGRKHIVDVEQNYSGLLAGLLRERTGIAVTHKILKFTGRTMSCTELRTGLKAVLDGKAPARTVLTHGA